MTIFVAVAVVVLWVRWLNAEMGGGGHSRRVAVTPVISVSGGLDIPADRATPYRLGVEKTTPTPAPTRTPVMVVTAPAPVFTPVGGTPLPMVAATLLPTVTPTSLPHGEKVQVILSTYWPDDGPDWCLTWDEQAGRCVSPLTSGDDFRGLAGRALACDPEWLGKTLVIPALSLVYPCLDTGTSFVCEGGPCTVGLLSRESREVVGSYEAILR